MTIYVLGVRADLTDEQVSQLNRNGRVSVPVNNQTDILLVEQEEDGYAFCTTNLHPEPVHRDYLG